MIKTTIAMIALLCLELFHIIMVTIFIVSALLCIIYYKEIGILLLLE